MNSMREGVDAASKQLDQNVDTSALGFVLLGVNAAVGSLERAKTQEEFNQAVDQLKNLPGLSPNMAGGTPATPSPGGKKPGPIGAGIGI